jgi:hypothetical protein
MNPTIVQVDTQSKYRAFPSLRKNFCQKMIHDMRKEVLGVNTPPGWHHIDKVKSLNSSNHCERELFRTDRLTHAR